MAKAESERGAILREIRELLEWELDGGGGFVPTLTRRAVAPVQATESAAAESVLPAAARPAQTPALAPAAGLPSATHPAAALAGAVPAAASPAPPLARLQVLADVAAQVASCTACALHSARKNTVFSRGNPESPLVFVGEGPGHEEDLSGFPFVGAAGQLLDKMVAAMGFARDDVYICNIVKCRPPNNRTPLPDEAAACSSYLHAQIDAVAPRVIVALGRCAAENMGLVQGGGWRGQWGTFRGIDVMPTYHPAFLLRSPEMKRPVWEDLQRVMQRLRAQA